MKDTNPSAKALKTEATRMLMKDIAKKKSRAMPFSNPVPDSTD